MRRSRYSGFRRGRSKYGLTKYKGRGRRKRSRRIPKYGSSRGGIRL